MLGLGGTLKEGLSHFLPPLTAEPKHIRHRGPLLFNGTAFSILGWNAFPLVSLQKGTRCCLVS